MSRCETPKSAWLASEASRRVTVRTLTSSAMIAPKSFSDAAASATTVRSLSGRRTRRLLALRSDEAVEQMSRAVSMAATRAWSAGRSEASGQSARCTERPPVSPRQISSVVSGSSGAATRHTTSSAV